MITLWHMTRRALVARSSFRTWVWWSPTRGWWWRPSWWRASSTSPSTSAAADQDTGTGGEFSALCSDGRNINCYVCLRYGHSYAEDEYYDGYYSKRATHNGKVEYMNTSKTPFFAQEVPGLCHTSSVISTSSSGVKMMRNKRVNFSLSKGITQCNNSISVRLIYEI